MNRSMIRYLLSKLLLIEAALLIVPLVVAANLSGTCQGFCLNWGNHGHLTLGWGYLVVFTNQRIFTSMLKKES